MQVKNTTQPRLWLEITLTGLLPSAWAQGAASEEHKQRSLGPIGAVGCQSPAIPPVSGSSLPAHPAQPPSSPVVAPTATPIEQPTQQPADSPADTPTNPPIAQPNEQSISPNNESSSSPPKPADADSLPSEPAEVAFGTLDELWTKILAALAPRGTQMLMSQQGVLMSFDGVGATVGFRSPTLHKMARERVPN